jgi:hypothetical protein
MGLLPDTGTEIRTTATIVSQPNKTYKMIIEDEKITGTTDDLAAIEQAIYKILNTERYKYVIYSWNYGVELADLFGKPIPWVFSELPRRIREALVQDDRIKDVTEFDLSHDGKGNVLTKFKAVTVAGVVEADKVVNIG